MIKLSWQDLHELGAWENAISMLGDRKLMKFNVLGRINKISNLWVRSVIRYIYNKKWQNYSCNDIASWMSCLRNSHQHCYQQEEGVFSTAQEHSAVETVCGLNETFYDIFSHVQVFIIISSNLHQSIDLFFYGGYLDF